MSVERLSAPVSGRLDRVLAQALGKSRNQVEKLIKEGHVYLNGRHVVKASVKVSAGDEIAYELVVPIKRDAVPVDFDVEVLYEDEDIMVINKPAGLVVHPAPSVKEPTLVDWLKQRGVSLSTLSGEERHGIVHRIDKETTGALLVAKNNEAHEALSRQLQDKTMGRYYLALIDKPLKESRIVEVPIARHPKNRLKMAVVEGGKAAKSAFVNIAESRTGSALIAAKLFTGRTHQIRVHLSHIGRHILGDTLYGFKSKRSTIPRVYLHAYELYVTHPRTAQRIRIGAPLFADMAAYIDTYFEGNLIDEIDRLLDSGTLFDAL